MKKLFKNIFIIFVTIVMLITIINFYVLNYSKISYYKDFNDIPNVYIWLVFWASVIWKDKPSDILKDRLDIAYEVYKIGKIEKIIVSWDNSKNTYNEPMVMQKYLIDLWVDINDIYLDYAWFDTYDSIYRAKEIFSAKELVLFTQNFHLKRAMYISKRLWIKTIWVETNSRKYLNENYNNFREIFARIKAFLEVEIFKSKPKYLWEKIEVITDEKINEAKNWILKNN